jgi:NhaP-type Na+/H+ or K+/H+ antiporter
MIGTSGILAIVTMGFYMSNLGKYEISSESEGAVHSIWGYIGFGAETIIFVLTGIIVGSQFADLTGTNVWRTICLYIALHIIRFFYIFIFIPILTRMGYQFTIKHAVLMAQAGLRGAVGLTLAMIVAHDKRIKATNKQVGEEILFYTCMIVLLTLLVNGNTTGIVINKLGLSTENLVTKSCIAKRLEDHNALTTKFYHQFL